MTESLIRVPVERIEKAIYLIRGEKVMLNRDLGAFVWSYDERAKASGASQ